MDWISRPWPWWVAGPLIGLVVPLLLLYGGKAFGISSSLRHVLAALLGRKLAYFDYDWKRKGLWSLMFVGGCVVGGFIAGTWLAPTDPVVAVASDTREAARTLGIDDHAGYAPADIFSWAALSSPTTWIVLLGGGFLLGFGARWASGCTSGHGVTGLANLQLPSFVAVAAFFVGGLIVTHLVLPVLLG